MMPCPTEPDRAQAGRPTQFSLLGLLAAFPLVGLTLGLCLSEGRPVMVHVYAGAIVVFGLALSYWYGRALAVDAAILGALWIATAASDPLLYQVRLSLALCDVHTPRQADWGKAIWLGSIALLAGVPALAGLLRVRPSGYALSITALLVLLIVMVIAGRYWSGDDELMIVIQWTGGVLAFACASTLKSCFRAQRWIRLAAMLLLIVFGLLVVAFSTAFALYFE